MYTPLNIRTYMQELQSTGIYETDLEVRPPLLTRRAIQPCRQTLCTTTSMMCDDRATASSSHHRLLQSTIRGFRTGVMIIFITVDRYKRCACDLNSRVKVMRTADVYDGILIPLRGRYGSTQPVMYVPPAAHDWRGLAVVVRRR